MKHLLLLLVPIVLVSVALAALAPGFAGASTGQAGAAIPESGRTLPAIVGLVIAFVTACAALVLWLQRRQRQAQAQRIVQEKAAEIRQLAEKTNYELHVKDLAEALGISRSMAEEIMRVMQAHLLSTRSGGGLYQLPHIVEKLSEKDRTDVGSPELRSPTVGAQEGAPRESGPAERPRVIRERGEKRPNPPGPA